MPRRSGFRSNRCLQTQVRWRIWSRWGLEWATASASSCDRSLRQLLRCHACCHLGAGCFPNGAALNHSCRPNCLLTYDLVPGEAPTQTVRVMEDVAEGVELTHSYVDLALPAWDRQQHLREVYGFDCACPNCVDGADRAKIDVCLVACADGSGATACSESCPLRRAPPSAERDSDLCRAERLMSVAAAEEDAAKEMRALEEVCVLRERWLQRSHVEVVAAHAAAHTAAIAAIDWEAAERHCRCLVEQYELVYPEWHPIAGLQMFTLGELLEARDSPEASKWYARALQVLERTHGSSHQFAVDLRGRLSVQGACGVEGSISLNEMC